MNSMPNVDQRQSDNNESNKHYDVAPIVGPGIGVKVPLNGHSMALIGEAYIEN